MQKILGREAAILKRARPMTFALAAVAALLALLHVLVWWDGRDDGQRHYSIPQTIETCLPEARRCRA